jgi:hypothetical protein
MALADIIEAVQAELTGIPVYLGDEHNHLQDTNVAPRIVFVPVEDRFTGASRTRSQGTTPRTLKTRRTGCDVSVWAAAAPEEAVVPTANLRACETLLHELVSAIHRVCAGSHEIERADWPTESQSHLGSMCVLRVWFHVPVIIPPRHETTSAAVFTTFGDAELQPELDVPEGSP